MSELAIRAIEVTRDIERPIPASMLGDGPTPEVSGFYAFYSESDVEDDECVNKSKCRSKNKGTGKGKSKSDSEAYVAHRKEQAAQDAAVEVYEDPHWPMKNHTRDHNSMRKKHC